MKAPNRMYLQFYGEDLLPGQTIDDLEEPADMENVTWCVDKIFNTDIEYIHKDVVMEIFEQLRSKYLSSAENLNEDHEVKEYILNRKYLNDLSQ